MVGFRPLLGVGLFTPARAMSLYGFVNVNLASLASAIAIAAAANNPALLILVFV